MAEQDIKPRFLSNLNRLEEKKQSKKDSEARGKDNKNPVSLLTGAVVNYLSVHEKESMIKIYKDSMTKNFSENFDKAKELGNLKPPQKKRLRSLCHETKSKKFRPDVYFNPKAVNKGFKELYAEVKFNDFIDQDAKVVYDKQQTAVMTWDKVFNPVEIKHENPLAKYDEASFRTGDHAKIKAFSDQKIRAWLKNLCIKTNRNKMRTDLEIFKKTTNPVDIEKMVGGIIDCIKDTTNQKHEYDKQMQERLAQQKVAALGEELDCCKNGEVHFTKEIFPQRFNEIMDILMPFLEKMKKQQSHEESKKDNDDYPGHPIFTLADEALKSSMENTKLPNFDVAEEYQDDVKYDYFDNWYDFIKKNSDDIDEMNKGIKAEKERLRSKMPLQDKRITMTHAEYMVKREKQFRDKMAIHNKIPFDDKKEFTKQRFASNTGQVRKMTQNEESYLKYFDAFKIIKKVFKGKGTNSFSGNLNDTIYKSLGVNKEEFDKGYESPKKPESPYKIAVSPRNEREQNQDNTNFMENYNDKPKFRKVSIKPSASDMNSVLNKSQLNQLSDQKSTSYAANIKSTTNFDDSTKITDINDRFNREKNQASLNTIKSISEANLRNNVFVPSSPKTFGKKNYVKRNFNVKSNVHVPIPQFHKEDSTFTINRKQDIIRAKYKTGQNFFNKTKVNFRLTDHGFFDTSCLQTNNEFHYRNSKYLKKMGSKVDDIMDNTMINKNCTQTGFGKNISFEKRQSTDRKNRPQFNKTSSQLTVKVDNLFDEADVEGEEKKKKVVLERVSPTFIRETKDTVKKQINSKVYDYVDNFKSENFTFSHNKVYDNWKGSKIMGSMDKMEPQFNDLLDEADARLESDHVANLYQPVDDLEQTRQYLRYMSMERMRKSDTKQNVAKSLNELKSHKSDICVHMNGLQKGVKIRG